MSNATIAPEVSRTASTAELRLPFEATAPAAEAWLLSLSTLSFSDSCRHLYHALRAVNRLDLAAHQRLQLLETLPPANTQPEQPFRPLLLGTDLSPPGQDREGRAACHPVPGGVGPRLPARA